MMIGDRRADGPEPSTQQDAIMTDDGKDQRRRVWYALAFSALAVYAAPAKADEADAKDLLKRMTDYLSRQGQLSFAYDASLEIITADMLKVGLASSGTLEMKRPDKLRMTRTGGFGDVELAFDGRTLSALGKTLGIYTSADMPGSVDDLVDRLRVDYGMEAPAADLLSADAYDLLLVGVTKAVDLGSGVIGGQVCDHLAFRTAETDWQIWIAQGDRPYPCRFEITSKLVALAPSYRIEIRDWTSDAEVSDADFRIQPGQAKVVPIEAFQGLDDVTAMLAEGRSP